MNAPLSERLPNVVALGGGHGLAASLQALRRVTSNLTAVVTVADDGGSSGRLREQFDILPPGDLRMALAALCGDDHEGRLWADVLQSRFGGAGPLSGHAIGNLLIAGIWERLGDAVSGLDMVARLLEVQGRVLPMASVPLDIEADVLGADPEHPDVLSLVHGQARVAVCPGEVMEVRLVPTDPPACPESVEAIRQADHIVLGPGSWFTSVLVHLLVPELAEAITTTSARRILTMNLVPADETAGFSPSHHLEVLAEHAPTLRLDTIVCDPTYADGDPDLPRHAAALGAELVIAPLRASDGSPRHDVNRLASVYSDLIGR
ncbi:uridine diphosphate-N-acetylglucosamine-binding protein YvcK [Propioniciclava coleopterorum]|uniref:Putative gluconeogenesis factor n=1 Tax=Propioniciclava coleopterorum TaxID=2714937 RepID=A0A6G7Y8P4_9ACTN|nr:uridine diphosphate-N-acetylglucosamine-binding protein YvcK [Propioniciclava coleopterorum]QIK72987.1 uridine diphosphate-N-acetylglucosamine-binding protein YvcK [Propioniciclava coleopterorum]